MAGVNPLTRKPLPPLPSTEEIIGGGPGNPSSYSGRGDIGHNAAISERDEVLNVFPKQKIIGSRSRFIHYRHIMTRVNVRRWHGVILTLRATCGRASTYM